MLIQLSKDWSVYKAGQIVDVYNGKGKQLVKDGIGFDTEAKIKPEIIDPGSWASIVDIVNEGPIEAPPATDEKTLDWDD